MRARSTRRGRACIGCAATGGTGDDGTAEPDSCATGQPAVARMTSDALMIAAIDLLLHPDAALLNIPEVTFRVAFWATLAALVFAPRVAAAVWAAATLSRGEARRLQSARVRALGRRVAAGIWLESYFHGAACGPSAADQGRRGRRVTPTPGVSRRPTRFSAW